jgi:hypothetical protein
MSCHNIYLFLCIENLFLTFKNTFMKKMISVFSLLCAMTMIISCGPTSDDAIKYNDTLVNMQSRVFDKESALIDMVGKNTPDKIDPLYKDLLTQIDKATDTLEKIGGFDGKTDMKDAVSKVLATYKLVATNEYTEIIKLAKMPDSLYTQDDDNKKIDLSKKIDDELDKAVNDFLEVQKGFAVKYKFELTTAEKEKK